MVDTGCLFHRHGTSGKVPKVSGGKTPVRVNTLQLGHGVFQCLYELGEFVAPPMRNEDIHCLLGKELSVGASSSSSSFALTVCTYSLEI